MGHHVLDHFVATLLDVIVADGLTRVGDSRCSARYAECCDGRGTLAGCACGCASWQAESHRRVEHARVGLEAKLGGDVEPKSRRAGFTLRAIQPRLYT
jgi:hypothetical protein